MTGDRAFLRFLEQTGHTAHPLAATVPSAARPPSRLPGQVDPATAAAMLASCDRGSEGGCRDRAVLMLLHRYGLRPVEVTRLQLSDLRWRAGEFVVHGKGGRVDVLPVLRDVGEAIVEYLRIRRAAPRGVAAVFLSARAPVQPMHKSSIGALVGGPAPEPAWPGSDRGRSGTRSGTTCSRAAPRWWRSGMCCVTVTSRPRARIPEWTYPRCGPSHARGQAPARTDCGVDPVTGPAPAAALSDLAEQYLALRRRLGFEMDKPGFLVRRFAEYCDGAGITQVTDQAVLDWSARAARCPVLPMAATQRGPRVRHLPTRAGPHPSDPGCGPGALPARPARTLHHEQRGDPDADANGRQRRPRLHAATFQTLIGLIAATGMRTCEAVRADDADIDPADAAITLHGKNRRDRRIPLHPTTLEALIGYQRLRDRLIPGYAGPSLLVNTRGRRLNADLVRTHFAHLVEAAGLDVLTPRPTLRALRHTFAVTTLTGWLNDDADTQASLPLLQAHMGHTKPRHTSGTCKPCPNCSRQPAITCCGPPPAPPAARTPRTAAGDAVSALAPILQGFFRVKLMQHKDASPHTISSYRDTWRLLLHYAQQVTGTPPAKMRLAQIDTSSSPVSAPPGHRTRQHRPHPQQPSGRYPLDVPLRRPARP